MPETKTPGRGHQLTNAGVFELFICLDHGTGIYRQLFGKRADAGKLGPLGELPCGHLVLLWLSMIWR